MKNFIKYDNGLSFNTHFSVCSDLTISDIPSLIIRLKELILTGIDIYTLYNQMPLGDQFDKTPIECNSTDITDGNIFSDEEADTINGFIRTLIPWIDIRNLQYTSNKLYYNDVDKVTMTISEI